MNDQNPLAENEAVKNSGAWILKALDDAERGDPRAIVMALGGVQQALVGVITELRGSTASTFVNTSGTAEQVMAALQHPTDDHPDPGADPEAEALALAEVLWSADPARSGAARTFAEDYAAMQDRYLAMARAVLIPGEDGTR
jgi:hypothetical protein